MSGVKKATVQNTLSKTVQMIRDAVAQCASMAENTGRVGREGFEKKKNEAETVHKNLNRKLPENLKEFLRDETAQWEALLRQHDSVYQKGCENSLQAESRDSQYRNLRCKSENDLSSIDHRVQQIRNALRGKDWYCDAENEEARQLRARAQGVLDTMLQNVSVAQEAQGLRRQSYNELTESEGLAQAAQREYDRLINLAKERLETQRIAEENKRNALNLKADLKSLCKDIESKNFNKFGNGCYSESLCRDVKTVIDAIEAGNYETSIPHAEKLKAELRTCADKIDAAQQAWTAAKVAAEKALSDARDEMASLNRDDLNNFSGQKVDKINAAFAAIDEASSKISTENFAAASRQISDSITALRQFNETANENKKLSNQRDEIADSIMQALCDTDYDDPSYYLKEEDNQLSDLCVVAAAPGGVGNMKLRIELSGHVSFEVDNIPDGREQLCIDSIRKMQEKLVEDEVRFDVTDWGRAENQNKVHLDVKQQTTQVQQTIQRQG